MKVTAKIDASLGLAIIVAHNDKVPIMAQSRFMLNRLLSSVKNCLMI
jgi:hypothetical protein